MAKEWALVTGASGGLGEAIARDLAKRGYDLVLSARGEAAMQRLAAELQERHGTQVAVEPIDLSAAGSAAALCDRMAARGIKLDILVNNAAFGMAGTFVESDADRLRDMLQLDIVSLTELTLRIGREMAAGGGGKILFVGSMAAYSPCPSLAAYAAAKAYLLSLGEALHVELSPKVGVTVLSPGLMETGFNAASGFVTPEGLRRTILPTSRVARIGLDALFAGRPSVVAGRLNTVMVRVGGLLPRHSVAKLSYRMGQAARRGTG